MTLTKRDKDLLELIHKKKFLRRDQAQVYLSSFSSSDVLNKRIRLLYHNYFIDKIYPQVGLGKGSSKQILCLDKAGAILLHIPHFTKPIRYTDNLAMLPIYWRHHLRIIDVEIILIEMCKRRNFTLHTIEKEYILDAPEKRIIPDLFIFIINKSGYVCFIEIDMGTEDMIRLKNKIRDYEKYYLSNKWLELPWTSYFKDPPYPEILFITDDNDKRIKEISRLLKESILTGTVMGWREFQEHYT